jgi:hypothetical protein
MRAVRPGGPAGSGGKCVRADGVVTSGPYAEGNPGRPLLPDGTPLPILS